MGAAWAILQPFFMMLTFASSLACDGRSYNGLPFLLFFTRDGALDFFFGAVG